MSFEMEVDWPSILPCFGSNMLYVLIIIDNAVAVPDNCPPLRLATVLRICLKVIGIPKILGPRMVSWFHSFRRVPSFGDFFKAFLVSKLLICIS